MPGKHIRMLDEFVRSGEKIKRIGYESQKKALSAQCAMDKTMRTHTYPVIMIRRYDQIYIIRGDV